MSSWNYRVVHSVNPDYPDEPYYAIHEAYSASENRNVIGGVTVDPVPVMADSLDQLRWNLTEMLKALDKPVLEEGNEPGEPM